MTAMTSFGIPYLPVSPMQAFYDTQTAPDIPFIRSAGDGYTVGTLPANQFFSVASQDQQVTTWQALQGHTSENPLIPLPFDNSPFHTRWFVSDVTGQANQPDSMSYTLTGMVYQPWSNERSYLQPVMREDFTVEPGTKFHYVHTQRDDDNKRVVTYNSEDADAIVQTMLESAHELFGSIPTRDGLLGPYGIGKRRDPIAILREFFEHQLHLFDVPDVDDVKIELIPFAGKKGLSEFSVKLLSKPNSDPAVVLMEISCQLFVDYSLLFPEAPYVTLTAKLAHEANNNTARGMDILLALTDLRQKYMAPQYPAQEHIGLPEFDRWDHVLG